MDRISIATLAASKSYTDASVAGGGAIKGKNCVITSIAEITGGHRVTFQWTLDNGTVQTGTMDVMDGADGQKGETGLGIKSASIVNSHLILILDDDTPIDAGEVSGFDTDMSHITDIDLSNLADGQILKYNGTTRKWENASAGTVDTNLIDLNDVDVENLEDGQIIVWDATAGRWKNADNAPSITVDPTPTQGSSNAVASGGVYTALQGKADSSDIPTKTSDLTNDSNFIADASYVHTDNNYDATAKGIVDGVTAALADKADVSDVPTKTSDLTNDSGFQTASDVAAAISGKVDTSAVGTTVASLTDGKVPASQLPSYVDDVIEAEDVMHFPVTGESGKIYVALDTNKTYRWSGSGYVEISESLALGETSSTAYAGNKGKANADAIDAIKDGTTIDSFSDVETALQSKADTSDIPTATSDLTNDSGFITSSDLTNYVQKSQTAGLLKNDGTVDTNSYAQTSQLPSVATASAVGLVKPDGSTITVDANGTISASGGGSGTVTSVAAGTGLDGGTITTSGTLSVKYGSTSGTACQGNDSRLSDSRTPTNHASNKVTSMTGYSKPSSTSAISTSDSLNTAIGKLEKALDGEVSEVAWDSSNAKLTKTKGGTTSDVVSGSTILNGLTSSQVTNALGYTPPQQDTNTHRPIQVNNVEVLGNNVTALNLKAGTNVSLSNSGGEVTISASGDTIIKTRYSVSYSMWSSSPNADGYYTRTITLNPTINTDVAPNVYLTGSGSTPHPDDTMKQMYSYVERCYLSGSTLTLYAKTKPTATFYIYVEGVAGSGSGSIVGNVIQPNGAVSGGGEFTNVTTLHVLNQAGSSGDERWNDPSTEANGQYRNYFAYGTAANVTKIRASKYIRVNILRKYTSGSLNLIDLWSTTLIDVATLKSIETAQNSRHVRVLLSSPDTFYLYPVGNIFIYPFGTITYDKLLVQFAENTQLYDLGANYHVYDVIIDCI